MKNFHLLIFLSLFLYVACDTQVENQPTQASSVPKEAIGQKTQPIKTSEKAVGCQIQIKEHAQTTNMTLVIKGVETNRCNAPVELLAPQIAELVANYTSKDLDNGFRLNFNAYFVNPIRIDIIHQSVKDQEWFNYYTDPKMETGYYNKILERALRKTAAFKVLQDAFERHNMSLSVNSIEAMLDEYSGNQEKCKHNFGQETCKFLQETLEKNDVNKFPVFDRGMIWLDVH